MSQLILCKNFGSLFPRISHGVDESGSDSVISAVKNQSPIPKSLVWLWLRVVDSSEFLKLNPKNEKEEKGKAYSPFTTDTHIFRAGLTLSGINRFDAEVSVKKCWSRNRKATE